MNVGPRIRALREERRISLAAFAQEVGVSTGLVSQVEREITDPSLETLRRIAKVLGVPIFSLFQDGSAGETVRVVRADGRVHVRSPHGDITYSRVSAGGGRLEVLEGVLEPGGSSSQDLWSHPSEECAVVLSGRLTLEVGDETWVLRASDSCTFDSRLPHRYRNDSARTCRFLLAVTPPSY